MQPITLSNSAGDQRIDDIIRGLVGIFEAAFPGRIRAYYLAGSYADGSAVSLSDIDLRVVFKGEFEDQEAARVRRLRDDCRLLCPVDIDLPPLSEARLLHDDDWTHEAISIKLAGVFLYGSDIRAGLRLPSLEVYTRKITTAPVMFFARLHARTPLIFPLEHPDPAGEFYGYDERDAAGQGSTKLLVHVVGFAASCILALRAGQIVVKKSDWLPAYRQAIGDEWTAFLETLYARAKLEWGYHIPESEPDRQALKELCQQALSFENYYLQLYRDYLLEQLRGDHPERQVFAARRLRDVLYHDSEILSALQTLQSAGELARAAADETLQIYANIQRQAI